MSRPIKFRNKFFIIIKRCTHFSTHCWYYKKIGTIQLVTDELFPPSSYTLIDKEFNGRGLYPSIDISDANVIALTRTQKFLFWLGAYRRRNKKLSLWQQL